MNRNLRKTVIAGNWKMNMTPSQTTAFMKELTPMVTDAVCDVVLCVPAIDIPAAVAATAGTNIHVGAENVHFEEKGAFTGEISAQMLTEAGVTHVVIGHSERRQYFGETDHTVNLRTKAAVAAGLNAITCVGETLAQREQGITAEIVSMQTKIALLGLDADEMKRVIIAYEPYGPLAPERPPRQNRHRKSARSFVMSLHLCMGTMLRRQPVFCTAVP